MDSPPRIIALRRVAALWEVLGIYLAGGVVTGLLLQGFKVEVTNPLPGFRVGITDAALLNAA